MVSQGFKAWDTCLLLQLVKSQYHRLCGTCLDSFTHEVTSFEYEGGHLLDGKLGFLLGCLQAWQPWAYYRVRAEANAPPVDGVTLDGVKCCHSSDGFQISSSCPKLLGLFFLC